MSSTNTAKEARLTLPLPFLNLERASLLVLRKDEESDYYVDVDAESDYESVDEMSVGSDHASHVVSSFYLSVNDSVVSSPSPYRIYSSRPVSVRLDNVLDPCPSRLVYADHNLVLLAALMHDRYGVR